jgi:hypothetical protein
MKRFTVKVVKEAIHVIRGLRPSSLLIADRLFSDSTSFHAFDFTFLRCSTRHVPHHFQNLDSQTGPPNALV